MRSACSELARDGNHESDGVFGDFFRAELGDIANDDSQIGRSFEIDIVNTNTEPGDPFQVRQRGHEFTRQPSAAHDNHLGAGGDLDSLLFILGASVADTASILANQLFIEPANRARFPLRENDKVLGHDWLFSPLRIWRQVRSCRILASQTAR